MPFIETLIFNAKMYFLPVDIGPQREHPMTPSCFYEASTACSHACADRLTLFVEFCHVRLEGPQLLVTAMVVFPRLLPLLLLVPEGREGRGGGGLRLLARHRAAGVRVGDRLRRDRQQLSAGLAQTGGQTALSPRPQHLPGTQDTRWQVHTTPADKYTGHPRSAGLAQTGGQTARSPRPQHLPGTQDTRWQVHMTPAAKYTWHPLSTGLAETGGQTTLSPRPQHLPGTHRRHTTSAKYTQHLHSTHDTRWRPIAFVTYTRHPLSTHDTCWKQMAPVTCTQHLILAKYTCYLPSTHIGQLPSHMTILQHHCCSVKYMF